MRAYILLVFLICAYQHHGQTDVKATKWKFSDIGIRAQFFSQHHAGLTFDQIKGLAKRPKGVQYDMSNFKQTYADPNIGETLGIFARFSKKKNDRKSSEVEIELDYYTYAELYTQYAKRSDYSQYIGWCLLQSRIDLELKYLLNYHSRFAGLRFGPSLGAGRSFNDKVMVFDQNSYEPIAVVSAESNTYFAAHANLQFYLVAFKRFEFGLGGKAGVGVQLRQPNAIGSFGVNISLAYKFLSDQSSN